MSATIKREQHEILDQLPPFDAAAEKAVIGSILLLPSVIDDVVLILREQDFYVQVNAKLFRHLVEMHNTSKRIDVTLLLNRLKKAGDVRPEDGDDESKITPSYVAEVAHSVPTAANAEHYARIVQEAATARTLIHASTMTLKEAYAHSGDAKELLQHAEERMLSILDDRGVGGKTVNVAEVLADAMVRLDRRRDGAGMGIKTGYTELDQKLCGLHEGELIIVAARPSMGKTSFVLNVAENAAVAGSVPTLFFSLEMSQEELADRLCASRSRVSAHRMRGGYLTPEERSKIVEASAQMSSAPLFIDDSPTMTMTEIYSTARRHKRKHGLRLVVVDYLQLISPDNPRDTRESQVSRIARRLKAMARELKVPVVCVAQLNRQAEASKENNRPKLSYLRESGAIEQDADVVLFVHREEYYRQGADEKLKVKGQADLIVAKQRNGPTGDIKLCWFQEFSRFDPMSNQQYEPTDFGSDWNNR